MEEFYLLNAKSALNMYKHNEQLKDKYITLDNVPEMIDKFRQLYCVDVADPASAIFVMVTIQHIQDKLNSSGNGMMGNDFNKRRLLDQIPIEPPKDENEFKLRRVIEIMVSQPYIEERFPQPVFSVPLSPGNSIDTWNVPRYGDVILSSNNLPNMTFFIIGPDGYPFFAKTGAWWKPIYFCHPLFINCRVMILDDKDHLVRNDGDFRPVVVQSFIEHDKRDDIDRLAMGYHHSNSNKKRKTVPAE